MRVHARAYREQVSKSRFSDEDFHLQGSYANHTNIRGGSDVDVLLICDDYARKHCLSLGSLKQAIFRDVSSYGCFSCGRKTIKFDGSGGFIRADIIPCLTIGGNLRSGIRIYDSGSGQIITNYPIQHKENGELKNKRTNGLFKPTIRMYKNIRNELISQGYIRSDCVSSYNLESMIYNIDDSCFDPDPTKCYHNTRFRMSFDIHAHIQYTCQNEKKLLLDNYGRGCWNYADAYAFIAKMSNLE